jgi:hypothetical protein
MKLLFSYNNRKIGSRFIRWVLREPVSHVAIQFSSGLIIHSTFSGVGLEWSSNFRAENDIPYEYDAIIPPSPEDEMAWVTSLLDIYMGQSYDYKAFIYFGWRALLLRLLGLPMPGRNHWNANGRYLCTELASTVMGREMDPMISPYQLYIKLRKESARA